METKGLISAASAFEFLEDLKSKNCAVIGIEGFIVSGDEILPRIDIIADFSNAQAEDWRQFQTVCNNQASLFLHNYKSVEGLCYEFCVWQESDFLRVRKGTK